MALRLATYNVEWFDALFDDRARLKADDSWSARHNVTTLMQTEALGSVFKAMDADAILIVEAPDTKGKKTTEACLRGVFGCLRPQNERRPDRVSERDPAGDRAPFRSRPGVRGPRAGRRHRSRSGRRPFDGAFRWDVDIDGVADEHVFSKPPLEFLLKAEGLTLRGIGVHVKSKAPHGAESAEDVVRISIANRRKQLAQCIWLRHRVEEYLAAGENVAVLGDFNDGPGLDEYEKLFGRSGVEIVAGIGEPGGQGTEPDVLYDPHIHARMDPRQAWTPSTARFYKRNTGRYLNALLDFIMLSDPLRARAGNTWRIWHPFDDGGCYGKASLRDALLTASDHFPVSVDIGGG